MNRLDGDGAVFPAGDTGDGRDAVAAVGGDEADAEMEDPGLIGNAADTAQDPAPVSTGDSAEILAVETDPKQPGMYRLTVRLPGGLEETQLAVHEDTLVGMRLLKGRRLDRKEWESLLSAQAAEEAYRAALMMLQRKARTGRELEEALKRKGFSPEAAGGAIRRLKARGLVDDAAYARRFAEQRVALHRKGSLLVRQELLRRGVSKAEADRALEQVDRETELEAAMALARKKWPQIKGDRRERKMKLTAFLVRRGFPGKLAKAAAERAAEEADASLDGSEAE